MVTSGIGSSSLSSLTNPPVTLSGLASGLDTKTMIQELMQAQQGQTTLLQNQISADQTQSQAVAAIKTQLSNLLSTISAFKDPAYLEALAASVALGGATPSVSASVSPSAVPGSFKVTVDQLATATSVSSPNPIGSAIDPTALLENANLGTAITAGTFTVNGVQISVDPTLDTLNAVMQRIQNAVSGSTVGLVTDAGGRDNLLQISDPAGVTLGSGSDTSNFLSAMNLLAAPGTTTRTSTSGLGVVRSGATLASAGLATPLSSTTGSFTINGVSFSYDASQDSLSTVLARINSSTAGVIATYNPATDEVSLVARSTGSVGIQLSDDSGNLLAAVGLTSAAQTLGSNAKYEIDTGNGNATYYSASNTVTNALPGVTLNLLTQGGPADTVTVSQDTNTIVSHVQDLVSQYDSTLDLIDSATAINPGGQNGVLAGDTAMSSIAETLRELLTAPLDGVTSGYTSPAQIGLHFGDGTVTTGANTDLTLDKNALLTALQANPASVANVFAAFGTAASLNAGGSGGIASVAGSPTGVTTPGTYSITTTLNQDGTANLSATFTPGDGSAAYTTSVSNVAPGATVTNLIPGLSLRLKGSLTAGTDTLTVTTPVRGIEAKLAQYLTPLTASSGALAARQTSITNQIQDLNNQISQMNTRLQQQQAQLQLEFNNMEQALAQLNTERSSLNIFLGMSSSSTQTL